MKALSLLQPWATLIMLGYKHLETRSWQTKHRGALAIHASAGKPAWARKVAENDPIIRELLRRHNLTFDSLPRGVIIGEVEVTRMRRIVSVAYPGNEEEVAPSQLSATERACGDYTPGRWAWSLTCNLQLNKFLPCRGALSVWEVPQELVSQFDYLPF